MTEVSGTAHSAKPKRHRRLWRALIVVVIMGVLLLAVAGLTYWVGQRALAAKASLEQAQDQLRSFQGALGKPDQDLPALYAQLQASSSAAVAETDNPAWWAYEHIYWIGPNLKAFRQTAVMIDDVVRDGIGPLATAANGVSVDNLKPHGGRVDLAPLKRLGPAMIKVDDAVRAANTAAGQIDTTEVIPRLADPITRMQAQLQATLPVTQRLRTAVPLLDPMLGGDGPRHYLLMFQNNAEERASGGNPASMALVTVDDGKVTLGRQASSTDFPHPYAKPPWTPTGAGNQDWGSIYTDYTSTYVTNITMTPDFPTTAKLAAATWHDRFGGTIDGVISFDPVALSYLLDATGPIKLADGTTIDQSNAVTYLLHDVYAKYPDGATQDKVFASAVRTIFSSMMSGTGDPQSYLAQLKPAVAEQRLKVWSAHAAEQKLLLPSAVGTMLPADNSRATVLGVYNNDDATSKMSYFTDQKIKVAAKTCGAAPSYTVSTTVTNTLKKDQVDSLPPYMRAYQQRIPRGGDRQWLQLYGPVGGKLEAAYVDGEKVVWGTNLRNKDNTNPRATGVAESRRPAVQGTMYGRPVGVVSITLGPEEKKTVKAVFSGSASDSETVTVSHTPKVRETPVAVKSSTCR